MKKILLTIAALALIAPLSACNKSNAKRKTAKDLIKNIQVVYDAEQEEAKVIDDEHLTVTLPRQEQWASLSLKIDVKGEEEARVIEAVNYSIVGEYNESKVMLNDNEDKLRVMGATTFTLKVAFHFADTKEDVEKEWATTWTLPATELVTIDAYNYGSLSNYGLPYNELSPSSIEQGTPINSIMEMTGTGVYGWSCHTALARVLSFTIEFNRLGVFSSAKCYPSKLDWNNFIHKDGDIEVSMARNDVVENKLTFDFADRANEFDGSDYYIKLWFWNDSDYGEGLTSLVKSFTFEVIPSM